MILTYLSQYITNRQSRLKQKVEIENQKFIDQQLQSVDISATSHLPNHTSSENVASNDVSVNECTVSFDEASIMIPQEMSTSN
jgi:hypothetical protein